MKIGIDATGLSGANKDLRTGITAYTTQIVSNLIEIDQRNSYVLYCSGELTDRLAALRKYVLVRNLRIGSRKLCQQITLPFAGWRDDVDVMFFPFNSAPILWPGKGVVTIHDLNPYAVPERFEKVHGVELYGSGLRAQGNRVYWRRMLEVACRGMDRIIANSHTTKRDIERFLRVPSEKIDVVYLGVDKTKFNTDRNGKDTVRFRKEHRLPERYLLCVGTHAYKNVEGLVRSFYVLRGKHHGPLGLVVAGHRGNVNREIFEFVQESNLGTHIRFVGFFPDEDLKYLYQSSELVMCPSFYEGFGLPVLEAFACGVPVVAGRVGALPEIVGDGGMLVDPNDVEGIADAAFMLLNDAELRRRKVEGCLEQVKKFSWVRTATETLEVFRRVVSER